MPSRPLDPRLKRVLWRDLVPLSAATRVWELSLPLPWLAASLMCYQVGWWPLGVPCSFFFFLTGLRLSHNSQHNCLGLSRRGHDLVLASLSVLMAASMHAVQVTHLHHHAHCLEEEDHEAAHVKLAWWRALFLGPVFPVSLHAAAWRIGSAAKRRWIAGEIVLVLAAGVAVFLLPVPGGLRWHAAAMIVGECFTGFFAVWIVHRGCDEHSIARTQRGWVKNVVSYSMFYHLEHHLFPAVPTCKLSRLAARIDEVAPELRGREVV
jgi:fatty acid desaturase